MSVKVRLYVATSLDGFVADPDHGLDWLFTDGDYGYKVFYGSIGGLIMGRKTYDVIRGFGEWPYKDRPCWVFSRTPAVAHEGVHFVAGRPGDLVKEIAATAEGPLWLVGGGEMTAEFMVAGLVDELIVTMIPIALGAGVPLFTGTKNRHHFEFVAHHRYYEFLQVTLVPKSAPASAGA